MAHEEMEQEGHLGCGQRLQTEEVETLIKGHGVIKSTHTIGRHRLEHGMSSFLECSMTSFVKSFSDVIPYISRC